MDLDTLKAAMRAGQRLDASAAVIGAGPTPLPDQRFASAAPHIPPFLMAGFQWDDSGDGRSLTVRDFEKLSLAARAAPFCKGLDKALRLAKLSPASMPTVDVADVESALAWAAAELGPQRLSDEARGLRRGLQLVGFRIVSGSREENGRAVNLKSARLPFPISFIGCVFETPLLLDNCEVDALDLSGSCLRGLQANGLRTAGDVHLRRATILSPASFSGARIGGLFDASDLAAFPAKRFHGEQTVDADHGMLNLSQVVIENELRLERARIWGGLSMRGATVHRSVFMTGAVVASALGVLEKRAYDLVGSDRAKARAKGYELSLFGGIDRRLAREVLHNPKWPKNRTSERGRSRGHAAEPEVHDALADLETLQGAEAVWEDESLALMLGESIRARANAIRADGLTIRGSLHAEHLQANGRIRMKYAEIQGGFRLGGCGLRSADAARTKFDELVKDPVFAAQKSLRALVELRDLSGLAFAEAYGREIYKPQDYALDLRESHITGDLTFDFGELGEPAVQAADGGLSSPSGVLGARRAVSRIDGRLALDDSAFEGAITAKGLRFHWRPEAIDHARRAFCDKSFHHHPNYQKAAHAVGQNRRPRRWKNRAFISWSKRCAKSCDALPQNASTREHARIQSLSQPLAVHAIGLKQAKVGGDLDLRESHGVWGVDLRDAKIEGSVKFSERSRGRGATGDATVRCDSRAHDLCGELNLRGARIDGDALLLFDPDRGPEIKADLAVIGGRLEIYPGRRSERGRAPSLKPKDIQGDQFAWYACPATHDEEAADRNGDCPNCAARLSPRPQVEAMQASWYIDLRNARATIFGHPPAAWPDPEALSLEGFRYERSATLGPLPPMTRGVGDPSRSYGSRRVLLGLMATFTVSVGALMAWGGAATLGRMSGSGLLGGVIFDPLISGLILAVPSAFAVVGLLSFGEAPVPPPMALEYLSRQRTEPNRFHLSWLGSRSGPLEPYAVAASALRETGRQLAAEEVERARLERSMQLLSFRHHPLFKIAMLAVSALTGFGFRLERLAVVIGALVICVAGGAYTAASYGYITHPPTEGAAQTYRGPCKPPSEAEFHSLKPPSFLYAIGLLTPGFELKGEERWEVAPCLDRDPWRPVYRAAPGVLRLIGALLFAVLGLAVAARIQTAFSGMRESEPARPSR